MIRSKRLGLILSNEEKELLKTLAKLEGGLSLAALIRSLIYREAVKKGLFSSINLGKGLKNVKQN